MLLSKKIQLFTITLIIFPFLNLTAQNCDWTTIDDANRNYEIGKFDDVISDMTSCISNGFNSAQKVQAYRLLSKSYMVTDQDSAAQMAAASLINIQPDYQPDYISDPPKFIEIIEKLKLEGVTVTVTSVSKKAENIEEAPASVILLTEKQIKRRGYLDLEAMAHDLPGFDISRSNGNLYSHLYQRGYRSINTNRTLFLIDGVEENDLWSGNVYLSRQYSMSNIKNVEVVYGPASTMYGSNAFLGVINIITKKPEDFIKKGKVFGVNAEMGYGSYNTKFADATVALGTKNKNVVFSLSGRLFLSDEQDLSHLSQHDYKPNEMTDELATTYHSRLDITDSTGVANFLSVNPASSSLYSLSTENQIILTDLGINNALSLDNKVYDKVEYSDKTSAYSLDAKLKVHDFLLGWSGWKKAEGPGAQYNDIMFMGADEGQLWQPVHNFFYLKYEKDVIKGLSISNFMRYKVHDFNPDNNIVRYRKYYSNGKFDLEDLMAEKTPTWDSLHLFQKSSQLRNELKVVWSPHPKVDIVSGFEARFSSIQGDYIYSKNNDAEETGVALTEVPGGNQIYSQDLGVYSQVSWSIMKQLKVTAGGRFDNNKIRETQGFGNVFNPRAAIVFMPSKFIFKAVYSEAFKDATNREKYSTAAGKRELANPELKPEKVKNTELTTGYKINKTSTVNISAYYSIYSNIIQEVEVSLPEGGFTNQNQPKGEAQIYGLNAFADYNFNNFNIYANYTYTVPYTINPTDSEGEPLVDADSVPYDKLRISDIATHQANIGVNYSFREYLNFNLRSNIMGSRMTGENTTVPTNPEIFDPYFIFNGAITYTHVKTGLSIQASLFNILDTDYSSPGLDGASGVLSSKLIQNKRNIHFKLIYQF